MTDAKECTMCGGDVYELGRMGSTTWYRCEHCGVDEGYEVAPDAPCQYCGLTGGEHTEICKNS